jgi:hypothetical protein
VAAVSLGADLNGELDVFATNQAILTGMAASRCAAAATTVRTAICPRRGFR